MLPVTPPLAPMLARLARELPPPGDLQYEPKWDGFRCLAFRDGDAVDLRSRNERPLARYFPEVVDGLRALREPRLVLDGELLVTGGAGADFPALLARLHPAPSRVALLAERTPATYVVFDLLAAAEEDLRAQPFTARRRRLVELLADAAPPVVVTPATTDRGEAEPWLDSPAGSGIDGVVVKPDALRYEAGKRSMLKVKHTRTVDCVVAGLRLADRDEVGTLLLGLWEGPTLHHVGVAAGFARPLRRELAGLLRPLVAGLEGHPWEQGFGLEGGALGRLKGTAGRWVPGMERDWVPLRPERVAEVSYDHLEGRRFRHPARLVRWRPDRDARSCTVEQLS